MTKRTGKCQNYANCDIADKREAVELRPEQEFVCPECGKPLREGIDPVPGRRKPIALAAAAALTLVAGGAGYWVLRPRLAPAPPPARALVKPAPQAPALACALKPASAAETARLLAYLKQGMNYALHESWNDALREFGEIGKIDQNFLSVSLNRGSALLRLGRLDEAAAALRAELDLVTCLQKLTADEQLAAFGYMLEVSGKSLPEATGERARLLRERLALVAAQAHFNLACIHARQAAPQESMAELRLALTLDRRLADPARQDRDLVSLRATAGFQALLVNPEQAQ